MKLVDILARELKVWPDGVFSLSQLQHNGAIINGKGYDGREWARLQIADDTPPAGVLVTEDQWQAAVDALKAEVHPTESMALRHQEVGRITRQWNGEGLPPVDLPCQWYSDSQTGWQEVVVLAYSGESAWIQPKGKPSIIVGNPANFLPIRTPEQIAAEVRQRAIEDLGEWLSTNCSIPAPYLWEAAQKIYDAGYRKFEIVDN